ncbi:hypothetical protein [Acidianus sp. HS-5]|uniref:hypothetical protein n=1 Tax=Acidianus sp. HS-5 TaxID=2886040 RepID=UPI001F3979F2|nr:hypothetical protein [Acidianus sp. HS-5]BDC18377.1 hypothetical protein HS5_12670 [Acidianus sp. HS-5]
MIIRISKGNVTYAIQNFNGTIHGDSAYEIGRALYFIQKAIYSIPRLYGKVNNFRDPLDSWKKIFESTLAAIISSMLTEGRIKLYVNFEIESEIMNIKGKIEGNKVSLSSNLLKIPDGLSNDLKGLILLDSFYFNSLEKMKPYILPSTRDGFLASFYKFIVLQTEGVSGIPKSMGLAAEFINSILINPGYKDEILGHQITVNDEGLFVDEQPAYNSFSEVLSLFSLKYFLLNSKSDNVVIIEDVEAHLSSEGRALLNEYLRSAKCKIVLVGYSKFSE